jgi:hypothetical protein
MNFRTFTRFAGKVAAAHALTYFIVGALAYQLLTKEFYIGPDPIFAAFMRTETEPELWTHVERWFFPAQILRGLLIAAVLYPFFATLNGWSFAKRFLSISSLYLVLGFWAAAGASPGGIEGMVYMRPFITPAVHFKVQPEIVVQGLALGALVAWWMAPKVTTKSA